MRKKLMSDKLIFWDQIAGFTPLEVDETMRDQGFTASKTLCITHRGTSRTLGIFGLFLKCILAQVSLSAQHVACWPLNLAVGWPRMSTM